VIDAESARVISHTTGAFISLALAALLLTSAVTWYKYIGLYQEWLRNRLPDFLPRSLFKNESSQQRFLTASPRNFGTIFLFLMAAYVFILGIRGLIT
jgi:hypothetical protein